MGKKRIIPGKSGRSFHAVLLVFEVSVIIGLAGFFAENYISQLKISVYLKALLMMTLAGGFFSLAFTFIEKIAAGALGILTYFDKRKKFNLLIHLVILGALYSLYLFLYYGILLSKKL